MKIFVLFEESAKVRDAFRALGHDAWSIDLLPTRGDDQWHIRADVWGMLPGIFDAADMIIAFPPCTRVCVSGNRYHANTPGRAEDVKKFRRLWHSYHKMLAIENPVGVLSKVDKPTQIIQPWQFGHPESKKTCLWLRGLPALVPTNILPLPGCGHWNNQTPSGQNKLGPSEHRARMRSETYQGIADAMAAQWGNI